MPNPPVAEYAGFYVLPAHRAGRTALSLVSGAANRHCAALERGDTPFGPSLDAGFGLFVVEPQRPGIQAIARAFFRDRPGIATTTLWIAGKRLG